MLLLGKKKPLYEFVSEIENKTDLKEIDSKINQ
jgi:hypothetical protein